MEPAKSAAIDGEGEGLVEDIYRAGAGLAPWSAPLDGIAKRLGLWAVNFLAVDKRSGTMLFSHEGGRRSPDISRDWQREYRHRDPRAALVAASAPGTWIACDEHFDEAYVAKDPFYQEFLIPRGGRYVYGAKVAEDAYRRVTIVFGRACGSSQLDYRERAIARWLARHIVGAWQMQEEIAATGSQATMGAAESFSLTPTEDRVARLLSSGRSPKEIAAALGITDSTVRSHLKALLAKTGTHRQSELVSVLLRSRRASR